MMKKDEVLAFLNSKISNKNIIKHMVATWAMMGGVYDYLSLKGKDDLGGTKEEWQMTGLLHDGDYREEVPMERQGIQVSEDLKKEGFDVPGNVTHAMAAHNKATGVQPESLMDWAIFCGDSLTGLIVATALILPNKKLAEVTPERVLRRFKEKSFAKGTRREEIVLCEEKLSLPLVEFVKISLTAMQEISNELGL